MQTGREAIDNLLRRRRADHVPLHDSPWGDTLQKWVGQGMPTNPQGQAVDPVEHFGFDMAGCGGWFDWAPKRGVNETVEETAEWKIVRNGSGALLKWWKDKSGTPEHVDFAMTSRAVWDRDYRPLVAGPFDRQRLGDLEAVRQNLAKHRAAGRWTFYGNIFIWELMRASLGDLTLYTSLLEDPDWIHDIGRVYTELFQQAFRILIDECGKPDGIWFYEDLGYKHRLFARPELLDELIFPYYRQMVEFFHGYDLPVILHSCGFQEQALPLIVAAGFDGLNPMEVKAGNDIFQFAERYGDQLTFVGGLDARILETGNRDQIRTGVVSLVEGMKQRGARFVYGSDHSISTNVNYQDFLYSLAVYREHQQY